MKKLLFFIFVVFMASCSTESLVENNQNLSIEESENNLSVEIWAQDLEVPWDIEFIDNTTALVTQRPGVISLIENGEITIENYYEVDEVIARGESGLMGLTKHPNFPQTPYLYVMYTYEQDSELYNRVVRLVHEGDSATFDRVIIDNILGARYHDGGRVEFGPDNKLYITTGDAGDPDISQDITSINGKILRVNDDGSIPQDNPFGSTVYSLGHRNPQGLAWDSNGVMFSSEHGPSGDLGRFAHDEINIIEKGENYGWPEVVGRSDNQEYVNPLVLWADSAVPPAGMDFYEGSLYVATLKSQSLMKITLDDENNVVKVERLFEGEYGRLRDVKAHNGYLYVLTSNRDGRGDINQGDDKVLRLRVE